VIKVTAALRKEINAAVRARVSGASPFAEVGLRGADWNPNALKGTEDDDLGDLRPLRSLDAIDVAPEHPTCALLDLYVTTGTGSARELETNVYVFIRDGHVIGSTAHSLKVETLRDALGFPETAGW
jgi:hypothetical protein